MAIFAKKHDGDPKANVEVSGASAFLGPKPAYGIAEAIHLMRSLPVDQHPDLVVRVVRATLGSLNVHLPDIIEDASRKQKQVEERIAAEHGHVADLEKQLETRRKEIAGLEADLKETSTVKERLQMAEKSAEKSAVTPAAGTSTLLLHAGSGPAHPFASKPPG